MFLIASLATFEMCIFSSSHSSKLLCESYFKSVLTVCRRISRFLSLDVSGKNDFFRSFFDSMKSFTKHILTGSFYGKFDFSQNQSMKLLTYSSFVTKLDTSFRLINSYCQYDKRFRFWEFFAVRHTDLYNTSISSNYSYSDQAKKKVQEWYW